jgi:hypothetical protein
MLSRVFSKRPRRKKPARIYLCTSDVMGELDGLS